MVNLELQGIMVVLRRVGDTFDDACRFPGTGISLPVGGEHSLSTLDIYVGVTLYVSRGDGKRILSIDDDAVATA